MLSMGAAPVMTVLLKCNFSSDQVCVKLKKRCLEKDGRKGSKGRRGVKRHEMKCEERKHGGEGGSKREREREREANRNRKTVVLVLGCPIKAQFIIYAHSNIRLQGDEVKINRSHTLNSCVWQTHRCATYVALIFLTFTKKVP